MLAGGVIGAGFGYLEATGLADMLFHRQASGQRSVRSLQLVTSEEYVIVEPSIRRSGFCWVFLAAASSALFQSRSLKI
ncbi:MAG: hypothetical protein QOD99_2921 [Chthoniobacter sp.]|jgi:hypothetical protein|nr:hypothetical protein [Chthoniobacter sp.]